MRRTKRTAKKWRKRVEKAGAAEDDAAGGGNGDGEWRWWWQDALPCHRVGWCAYVLEAHACTAAYTDSSLKIQMEYRAFEQRSVRGGGALPRVGQGRAECRGPRAGGGRGCRRDAARRVGEIFQKSNIDQSCQSYPP
ncbi:hypothetical protein KM043_012124 [Ampulex compressa]|nr:hypothetical protein KM043_012124 [Ampulex compressa]